MIETGHAGGGLFRHTLDLGLDSGIEARLGRQLLADAVEERGLLFVAGVVQNGGIALSLGAQDHEAGGIAAVIENHVGGTAVAPLEDAVGEGPVLVEGLALVGEHRDASSCDRGGSVVLGGEDVAAGPAHFSAESHQGFDQNGGLNRHVQGTRNAGTLEGLLSAVLAAQGHQTGHLGLGDFDLLTAEISQTQISDHIGTGALQSRRRGGSHHGLLS